MRETIAEYIAAERDYRDATMPLSSHGQARVVKHNDPRLLRYRDARAALTSVVSCGSCGTPIQADVMTGTTCGCAPTIPKPGRDGKFTLTKAGALAILARTRQFFGGEDDYWDWDDGEPFDKGALDAAIKAVTELLAADDECDQCEAAWHEAQTNSSGDESPGWWEKEAKRRWQKLGRARKRRSAAIKALNVVR